MSNGGEGSITIWIGDLKAGGDAAAQHLWERYFERLVRLAREQLRGRPGRVADEEDAALSAFDSFYRGAKHGRFPQLADRDDLWRILVVITQRKVFDQMRSEKARRRGGGHVRGEAALGGSGPAQSGGGLDRAAGARLLRGGVEIELENLTPEFSAMIAEEFLIRLDGLDDDGLREIAIAKMEGYTDDEIATRIGFSRRYVQRKLAKIRQAWSEYGT
jgi:DNA-directed RNA polymerase specialized sigma24 family protein